MVITAYGTMSITWGWEFLALIGCGGGKAVGTMGGALWGWKADGQRALLRAGDVQAWWRWISAGRGIGMTGRY